ncbi:MAG: hypothetical protein ISP90_14925 [Nevskia sp.]|nr:hypothetical protein [Nevskia sp.]
MRRFIEELKRRGVLRAAALYAAAAWVLVQVATQVFPFFDIPNWTVRLVVAATVVGFPFAMVISWFFEWTASGWRLETGPAPGETGSIWRRRSFRLAALSAAGIAAAVVIAAGLVSRRPAAAEPVAAEPAAAEPVAVSIAVMPFRNLSASADNAYFAEGVQEEILTRLARIGSLKVISRASTAHYASAPDDLPKVAAELGVGSILEGSVQRYEDEVRINVQLIRARDSTNVWAETYDRRLNDAFGVESEVARAIADALQATLTGAERRALDVVPTANAQAYDLYLRGLAFDLRSFEPADLSRAADFLRQAVALDPGFAVAWARLARVHASLAYQGFDPGARLCELAGREAAQALRLQPDSGEVHLAQGHYLYLCKGDLEKAQAQLEQAQLALPGSAEVLETLGSVQHRRGAWEKSLASMRQASLLDPRNTRLLGSYALTLAQMRRFDEARAIADRALEIAPDDTSKIAIQVYTYQADGLVEQAQRLLDAAPPQARTVDVFEYQVLQLLYLRRLPEAIERLRQALGQDLGPVGAGAGDYFYLLGVAQRAAGDAHGAARTFADGRAYLQRFGDGAQSSDTAVYVDALLCLMDAGRGGDISASRECRATASAAGSAGPYAASAREALARADALAGRTDAALAPLQELLHASYYSFVYSAPLTPALLRLDPVWDALRADPRFGALSWPAQAQAAAASPGAAGR